MLEIPEAATIAEQINRWVRGRRVMRVVTNQSPHKFAWYHGDPHGYHAMLYSKEIEKAVAFGGMVELQTENIRVVFSDGVALRYHRANDPLPTKHQLLIEFDDLSAFTASVQMYGGLWCFEEGELENGYYQGAKTKPSPLSNDFNREYFQHLLAQPNALRLSAKAFLATEQRIPGLGNGVLQDILFHARIHPKSKMNTLTYDALEGLFNAIKSTLTEMSLSGGRDTERDLFGCNGGYRTILSKKSLDTPCRVCGGVILKENYMGGSIYYCCKCQTL